MIDWVYFDTNFFYHLITNKFDNFTLEKFKDIIKERRIICFYTPVTFIEVAKHINKKEAGEFSYYKNVLKKIKEWCGDNIREYPDQALARSMQLKERKTNDVNDLNKFRDMILDYDNYKVLKNDYNFATFQKFTAIMHDTKNGWCKYLQEHIKAIVPNYSRRIKDGMVPRLTDKNIRADIQRELESDEFKIKCVEATLYKATELNESCLIGKASINRDIENIYKQYSAYFSAYKSITKQIIDNGYSVSKNKNDFEDVHLLIYLGYGQNVRLISYDARLKSKIIGCKQEKQVITIKEML